MIEGYIPKDERKKILLLCDDIRVHSGIATVTREVVLHTAHRYNWFNVAGAINHPEEGKMFDLSEDTNNQIGINDSSIHLTRSNGYGSPELIRALIKREKPDAIMLVTDPRYFTWLFNMENEIRKNIPIIYLNIWDDYPAPQYNEEFYESCDALFGISKQTVNINKIVLGEKAKNKIIRYLPHGLSNEYFKPMSPDREDFGQFLEFKKNLLQNKEYDFVLYFNSRNIRRKQIQDTLLAYRLFIEQLPLDERNKCAFILHTTPVDPNGTDIPAVVDYLDIEGFNILLSAGKLSSQQMGYLQNIADATILLTSNEGWGLALTESLLSGTPIIANVTGGMQDQMRFENENGDWIDFDEDFPSNHRGTYKKHGEWAFPCYPTSISMQGSPQTPYIWDDRCSPVDASNRIMELYKMDKEERVRKGMKGCEWANGKEAGFNSLTQANRFIEGVDELFKTWKKREKYELLEDTDYKVRKLRHKLIY